MHYCPNESYLNFTWEFGSNDRGGNTTSNKVFLQTSLQKNLSNLSYIFILSVKFENLTIGLHVLILSFILAKFQEDQRSIAISSNKC